VQRTIAALEEAFRRNYRDTVQMPARLHVEVPPAGVLLMMPCHDKALPGLGVKLVAVRNQAEPGLDTVQASYLLLDADTLEVRASMAANYLTDVRTAATSAIATKYLARPEARTLGVFGTGRQAQAHIRVLCQALGFERVLVCGSRPERSRQFAQKLSEESGFEVTPVEAWECVEQSDVICACTTSKAPLFDGVWVQPGTHMNLVGAFQPDTREVDDETIRRARVVVDTYEGALGEAGDLLIPLERGVIARSHIVADLHEIVSGKKAARGSPEEITVFKSVGCALEDLVAAKLVYDQAFPAP
jgi:ornithine cyclodeaminase/alanine dehydrogenase-like protein (mu-crystallin family)